MKYLMPQTMSNLSALLMGILILVIALNPTTLLIRNDIFFIALLFIAGTLLPFLCVVFFIANVALRLKVGDWKHGFVVNLLITIIPLITLVIYLIELTRRPG